jgi:uncharacterized membrane protein
MNAARHSVIVKAPIGKAYEQWSRVEDLPKFITPLRNRKTKGRRKRKAIIFRSVG